MFETYKDICCFIISIGLGLGFVMAVLGFMVTGIGKFSVHVEKLIASRKNKQ